MAEWSTVTNAHWAVRENRFRLADTRIANVVVQFRSPLIAGWCKAHKCAAMGEALFRQEIENTFFEYCSDCKDFERR